VRFFFMAYSALAKLRCLIVVLLSCQRMASSWRRPRGE
jgi:hypothetical protein